MTKAQQTTWTIGTKITLVAGASAFLIALSGMVASAAQPHPPVEISSLSTGRSATSSATPSPTPTPVVETKTVTVDEPIAFQATTVNDPAVAVGTTSVTTPGQNGTKTKTYRVTLRDCTEQSRELVSETVTTAPVDQVTTVGTMQPAPPPPPRAAAPQPAPAQDAGGGCDPNYSGCVPIASDVDCAGGSGNGPAYVAGPVQVIGSDIYDLDRDGDGQACE
ncbi:G5 domain-containing protein [Leifsonia sp. NPDC058292]|uniref:G5 domain-containing protein n=1 Tax=Leifsonia sp. NPDC058292 TaxID=3346428 RepID=UPI0036DD020F